MGLQTVAQGVLGAELANNTEAPLAATATTVFGSWGAKMLLIGGVISIYSTVSGDLLNTPRVLFASARDGSLPGVFARVHPEYKTPHIAIAFYAAAICVIALSGTFEPLAVLASGSILMVYGAVCLAVLRLRQRDGLPREGQFKLPFGPTIPVLGVLIIGWVLSQLAREEAIGLAALVAVSVIYYVVNSYVKGRRAVAT
jgi:amino acid transporter